jgi:hypothetical protein
MPRTVVLDPNSRRFTAAVDAKLAKRLIADSAPLTTQ